MASIHSAQTSPIALSSQVKLGCLSDEPILEPIYGVRVRLLADLECVLLVSSSRASTEQVGNQRGTSAPEREECPR